MQAYQIKYGGREVSLFKNEERIALQKKVKGKFEVFTISEDMESALEFLRGEQEVLIGTHVYHFNSENQSTDFIPNGELYLVFSVNNSSIQSALLAQYHLEVVERRSGVAFIVKVTEQSFNPVKTAFDMQQNDLVLICEPEFIFTPAFASEPLLSKQWHLEHPGAGISNGVFAPFYFADDIDANVIAARTNHNVTGEGVRIAVIDVGIETDHPDFADDKFPFTLDAVADDADITPQNSQEIHGTRVAGVAAASDNGVGTLGVASDSKVIGIRVADGISDTIIERAFGFLVDKNVAVACNTWEPLDSNFQPSTRMQDAIENLIENGRDGKGTCVLFAAGNRFTTVPKVSGLAKLPLTISIGACNSKGYASTYSQEGIASDEELFCVAPSDDENPTRARITTSDLTWGTSSSGNYTDHFGGTSSATALATGVIALMIEANPELTVVDIKQIIRETCDKIGTVNSTTYRQAVYNSDGWDVAYGYGRINADKAVAKAIEMREIAPVVEALGISRIATKQGSLLENERKYFSVELLSGFTTVILNSRTRSLNADVYVQKNVVPVIETDDYVLKSENTTNSDVAVGSLPTGLYYFLVVAKTGSGAFSLTIVNRPS